MKSSSITFLVAIFSLIAFSAFVATFPHGIDIASKHKIVVSSPSITFYGGMKGNGSFCFYATNSTINGENVSYAGFEGKGYFYLPSVLCIDEKAYCKNAYFNATGVMKIDENESYGKHSVRLEGQCIVNFSSANISFFRSNENIQDFLKNVSTEGVERITNLIDLLPIPMDSIFYINGNGSIDEMKFNKSELIFRGSGEYKEKKFYGGSYLIIKNKKFFEKEKEIKIGAFPVPYKLIYIWVVAIAIFIASLFIKKEREFDKKFAGIPAIISLLFIAITFYLWEKQATVIFGVSFFHSILNANLKTILTMIFIITPYMEVIALIAFPARLAISSLLSFFGLDNIGKTIGNCIGYPVAIWLGIKMLPSLLNMIFLPLLRLI